MQHLIFLWAILATSGTADGVGAVNPAVLAELVKGAEATQTSAMAIAKNGELFSPLGITQYTWQHDPTGTPFAMSGLALRAGDLLKIGQLVLQGGRWEGHTILSEHFIRQLGKGSSRDVPNNGLLWWTNASEENRNPEPLVLAAQGYLGQYLVVRPQNQLVAVRLFAPENADFDEAFSGFQDFFVLLPEL